MTKRQKLLYTALKNYTDYWGNLQDIDEDDQLLLDEGLKALDSFDLLENNPYLASSSKDFANAFDKEGK